ncbi:enoyl-CoA hydratase/isomerase family protein [Micromonospora sp. HUAS LYJ1]|uniref:enoyl-CoA hydratase/isomerase family protein n=1 Tax=Micromonospora sp. HUAS LYJ1 TaxID=3061626 RepID=UPI002671E223|nr:enoyl-CoA hydratase/isomerase family protein [Micromonospora sp. HUAS LYJ1]WKU03528.1 enoyl-CoA hydratase/isomerase family protein [Micromonospora sp. HUAS LYJ1]
MNATTPLLVEDTDGVRRLMFNRPEVHNAQDVAMLEMLDEELNRIPRDRSVRAVVLAGAGRSFCAGHDLTQMHVDEEYGRNASTVEGRFEQEMRLFVEPVRKFRELPVPTVCRVQGHCLAAGLMFAGSADFVLADRTARFGSPIVTAIAVNDAEVASFALRVGESWAKRVFWLDERLDAEQAHDAGLVTWVLDDAADLDRAVADLTRKLVAAPRETLALSKQTLRFMADLRGERDVNRFHFMAHQLSHWTKESQDVLAARMERLAAGRSAIPDSQRRGD